MSQFKIKYLDEKIAELCAELCAERERIERRMISDSGSALEELRNSSYEIENPCVHVIPSEKLKDLFPKYIGSQESFNVSLANDYFIYVCDCGFYLKREQYQSWDMESALKFLKENGVKRSQVSYRNNGHNSIAYCQLMLDRAVKERDELLLKVDECFEGEE